MLFGKHREYEELIEIKQRLKQSTEKTEPVLSLLEAVPEQIGALQSQVESLQTKLDEQMNHQHETEKLLRRQSASFEDFLDEFQEQKEGQENTKTRENTLVALICACRRQLELLEKQVLKDPSLTEEKRSAWESQFALMDRECQKQMKLCGLEEFGSVGEEADYRLYEILSTKDSSDPGDFGTVAEVYAKGHIYQGTVIKKAQASVYKLNKERNLPE